MNTVAAKFNRLAEDPPPWMRLLFVPLCALVAVGMAARRGWWFAGIAAVVYCGIGLAMAINPRAVTTWSRQHPGLDGAILGPLVFLAAGYLTSWPWWGCLIAGIVGALAGLGLSRWRKGSTDAAGRADL